jgi:hypothetical protein
VYKKQMRSGELCKVSIACFWTTYNLILQGTGKLEKVILKSLIAMRLIPP